MVLTYHKIKWRYNVLKTLQKKLKRFIWCISNTNLITIHFSWRKWSLHLEINLTRSKFEELADSLIRRTMEPTRQALKDAGLSTSEIDEVILVGGSTRIPAVQEAVKKNW